MNPGAGLHQLSRRVGPDRFTYLVHSRRAQTVKLPHLYYPGYQVAVNGHQQRLQWNHMAILRSRLSAGTNRLQVTYQPTRIQRVSAWISALAWLGAGVGLTVRWVIARRNHRFTK
jgi:uncharacterized membrane protein YfhO